MYNQNNEVHNPNPFDFVRFSSAPTLKTIAEFEDGEETYSGYIELKIKALTPVHIVGEKGDRVNKFFRTMGSPCIPASTIRGCIRSYIEALTNGWVSQANDNYEKENGRPRDVQGRHIGFKLKDALPNPDYIPNPQCGKIDTATYLFGLVSEKDDDQESFALKSRVWFEDAFFTEADLEENRYWTPYLDSRAFMGGGKPNISSWWYFEPGEIRRRNVNQGEFRAAEFVGSKLRGRKFYFHQVPLTCVAFYDPESQTIWHYADPKSFYERSIECVEEGQESQVFRIYINKLPKTILILLILSLLPEDLIRHKLGYGKPFGYGSIEFALEKAMLRLDNNSSKAPDELEDIKDDLMGWLNSARNMDGINQHFPRLNNLIDWNAYTDLKMILCWDETNNITFTYPPFSRPYFSTVLSWNDLIRLIEPIIGSRIGQQPIKVNEMSEILLNRIIDELYQRKKTIEFRKYQSESVNWDEIEKRRD